MGFRAWGLYGLVRTSAFWFFWQSLGFRACGLADDGVECAVSGFGVEQKFFFRRRCCRACFSLVLVVASTSALLLASLCLNLLPKPCPRSPPLNSVNRDLGLRDIGSPRIGSGPVETPVVPTPVFTLANPRSQHLPPSQSPQNPQAHNNPMPLCIQLRVTWKNLRFRVPKLPKHCSESQKVGTWI